MAHKLGLPLLLLLAACGQSPGADNYRFERKEYDLPTATVSIVQHKSVEDLRSAAAKAGAVVEDDREIMAWSTLRGASCTIHIVNPTVSYQPQWLGHEVAHCFWGQWHT